MPIPTPTEYLKELLVKAPRLSTDAIANLDAELFGVPVPADSTSARHRNTYAFWQIMEYQEGRAAYWDLLLDFQHHFDAWTEQHFASLHIEIKKFFRQTLRSKGIFINRTGEPTGPIMADLLKACRLPQWPYSDFLTTTFVLGSLPYLHQQQARRNPNQRVPVTTRSQPQTTSRDARIIGHQKTHEGTASVPGICKWRNDDDDGRTDC